MIAVQDSSNDWFIKLASPHVKEMLITHRQKILNELPLAKKAALSLCYSNIVDNTDEILRIFFHTITGSVSGKSFTEIISLLNDPDAGEWSLIFAHRFQMELSDSIPLIMSKSKGILARPATRIALNVVRDHPQVFLRSVIRGVVERVKLSQKYNE